MHICVCEHIGFVFEDMCEDELTAEQLEFPSKGLLTQMTNKHIFSFTSWGVYNCVCFGVLCPGFVVFVSEVLLLLQCNRNEWNQICGAHRSDKLQINSEISLLKQQHAMKKTSLEKCVW